MSRRIPTTPCGYVDPPRPDQRVRVGRPGGLQLVEQGIHLGVMVTHANRIVAGTQISLFRQPEALRIVAPRGEACGAGPCDGGGATWPRRRPGAYAGDPSPSGRYREDVTEDQKLDLLARVPLFVQLGKHELQRVGQLADVLDCRPAGY